MEFTRRTTGWFMPILITLSLSHILFWGVILVGCSHSGLSLETVMYRVTSPVRACLALPPIFLLPSYSCSSFWRLSVEVWRRDFIVRLANCLTRRLVGGAGLVSVVGSGLMGSVTGSAVANTVSIGVITIPMMKNRIHPRFAAGVEAAASTGGALMPPVMGAGAFVLASYTQISYLTVIAASALPACFTF